MTTLHDRLADLADDAPSGGPAPDLWSRATRYHRRRRVGTVMVAVAAVLALLTIAGTSWQRSGGTLEPAAPPSGQPGLPDQLYTPSPWLPGTNDAGPLGTLAAVVPAERGSWSGGREVGLVGVSADTGEYRFLDLPDRAAGGSALSPDGRTLAYWVTGDTTGSPNAAADGPVTGVAVYDSTTGETRRHDIETEHGLGVGELHWVTGGYLVFDYGHYRGGEADDPNDQSSVTPNQQFEWQLDREAPEPLLLPEEVRDPTIVGAGEGRVLLQAGDAYWNYVPDEQGASAAWPMLGNANLKVTTTPVFGFSFAFAAVNGSMNPSSILVGEASGRGARTDLVPDSDRTYEVLDWNGPGQLVVERAVGSGWDDAAVFKVDVETGRSIELVRLARADDVRQVQFAAELFEEPTVDGKEPPSPMDPRAVAGLVAMTVLAGLVGIVVWRRRVRP